MSDDAPDRLLSYAPIALALLAVGIAIFLFYRAVRGYRDGKAKLAGNHGTVLEADRDDDPVGFSTAVWANAAMGLFALAGAAWLLWVKPAPASLGAADIEHAGWCSDLNAAQPMVHVRNLACQPGVNGRKACDYEAMIGTEFGPWARLHGEFRLDRRTRRWCFDTPPEHNGAAG